MQDSPFACMLMFPDPMDALTLRFDSEKMRELWMVKLATCSHQMVRAQLDEVAYKFYTMSTKHDSDMDGSCKPVHEFFLTQPFRVTHNFAISQTAPITIYHPIRMLSHSMKIFERIFDSRIREIVKLSDNQCGFVSGCGTIDVIHAARLLGPDSSKLLQ
ncbi:unnamed protein product [Heligmosomoides polygyrus]|uniref:Reverse transcriptase domain-containing protein n=1 Tax=Heligmosomoides polygyrus TaxID=6339 RepID=A0A183GM06_HELPZ|nr:unnamed protein product [Heligmosomoides polygyrus]